MMLFFLVKQLVSPPSPLHHVSAIAAPYSLVSPATGCEKNKLEASTTGPWATKLSILEHVLVFTDDIGSGKPGPLKVT